MQRKALLAIGLFLVSLAAALPAAALPKLFAEVDPASVQLAEGERMIAPKAARLVTVDRAGLAALVASAPAEFSEAAKRSTAILALPDAAGGEQLFRLIDSPIMEPGLAAQFPEIRTFLLQGVDRPEVHGRGDITPQGFHAVLRSPEGMWYVDPLRKNDNLTHQIYWRRDLTPPTGENAFRCETGADILAAGDQSAVTAADLAGGERANAIEGGTPLDLRTYRLALAATVEYVAFHGGTVPLGQAAIVTAMNRVNEIYEYEVAIRMILVANNSSVVFAAEPDNYTNNSGGTMLGQNVTNLNNIIGSANYDIGHVFSTGGGGVAGLGVVCGASKARGVTGLSQPTGDGFYIDYVAHEMGHQWGGNHSFNGNAGSCGGGNRNASTAYEPGSGTSIMAYAGICGNQDTAEHSDPFFHRISLNEIQNYSRTGNGNNCKTIVAVGNLPPTVDAGSAYTIPVNTPFALTASAAVDSDGSGVLTYMWEEWDLGPAGGPNAPSGNAPIFRSFPATTSRTRTFPQVSDLVNNTQTIGELLPTYARTMNFQVTVRDMDLPAGNNGFDQTSVTVDAASGPFLVTAPNTAVAWNGNGPHNVTWNVANTTASPVSCANVDIYLSTDGGLTFPNSPILAATPNDGSADVTVSTTDTTTARIKVQCAGNIFFDISNANFSITGAGVVIFEDGFETGNSSNWDLTTP